MIAGRPTARMLNSARKRRSSEQQGSAKTCTQTCCCTSVWPLNHCCRMLDFHFPPVSATNRNPSPGAKSWSNYQSAMGCYWNAELKSYSPLGRGTGCVWSSTILWRLNTLGQTENNVFYWPDCKGHYHTRVPAPILVACGGTQPCCLARVLKDSKHGAVYSNSLW